MNRCASVRRSGTTEPCTSYALRGHTLCGRHARMRNPVLWVRANMSRLDFILKIQAFVRGCLIRKRLSYAGPGVLSRKDLTNDEDIISYNDKTKVHPMDFFSFEENGKVWWFEFNSLWSWCMRSVDPVNPYTKVLLSTDTRKRLRTVWGYKRRHREELPQESMDHMERTRYRTHILLQHFEDYGFAGIQPSFLLRCDKNDFVAIFVLLQRDIETVLPASDPFRSRISSICALRTNPSYVNHTLYILNCLSALLYIVTLYRDPYVVTFSILSAFYRA